MTERQARALQAPRGRAAEPLADFTARVDAYWSILTVNK